MVMEKVVVAMEKVAAAMEVGAMVRVEVAMVRVVAVKVKDISPLHHRVQKIVPRSRCALRAFGSNSTASWAA